MRSPAPSTVAYAGPPARSACIVRPHVALLPRPVSDHFDGERFFDPCGAPPRSRWDLLRWIIDRMARHQGEVAGLGAVALCRPSAGRVEGAACRICLCRPCELAHSGRGSIFCSTRYGRSAHRLSASLDRSVSTIPASPLPICRRSMSFWCRTAITIISILRPCRGSPPPSPARHCAARQRYHHAQS